MYQKYQRCETHTLTKIKIFTLPLRRFSGSSAFLFVTRIPRKGFLQDYSNTNAASWLDICSGSVCPFQTEKSCSLFGVPCDHIVRKRNQQGRILKQWVKVQMPALHSGPCIGFKPSIHTREKERRTHRECSLQETRNRWHSW